jgi:hypothetical protein
LGYSRTIFTYGQQVIVSNDFNRGFYQHIPGTIVGVIRNGAEDKFKVEFQIKHLGKSVVKIVPPIMIRGTEGDHK